MKFTIQTIDLRLKRVKEEKHFILKEDATLAHFSHKVATFLQTLKTSCGVLVANEDGELILDLTATYKNTGFLFVKNEFNNPNLPRPEEKLKTKYLQLVDANHNNNKYYRLTDNGDGTFTAKYGRNGVTGGAVSSTKSTTYTLEMFYIKYLEKISKGYVDHSDLLDDSVKTITVNTKSNQYAEIREESVKQVIEYLQGVSRQIVNENYEVAPVLVSENMLDKAQEIIANLYKLNTINDFNKELVKLFTVIPRRMKRVQNHLANTEKEFENIIASEKQLLDNMMMQIKISGDGVVEIAQNQTVLDVLGITVELADNNDYEVVKSNLPDELKNRVSKVFRVKTHLTDKRYQDHVNLNNPAIKLLWHGSKNENWLSIMSTGLSLNPAAEITGKMFGSGIYFAPSAKKSMGYTSHRGSYWANGNSDISYMGLFETAYGNPYMVHTYSNHNKLTPEIWKSEYSEYDCLHAVAGASIYNDEIIYFREDQVNMKYLVEFSN